MYIIIIFILGTIIGSFLNVCIYRIPKKESIAFPSSYCTLCNTSLKWYDLIPILSYLLLKGKCRYCRGYITPQYPIIELLNGIIYTILLFHYGMSLDFIYFSIIISILLIISSIDYYHQIIPDTLLLLLIAITVLYRIAIYYTYDISISLPDSIISSLLSGLLFTIISLISNEGMGGGDIKLIAILSFILGFRKAILNILLSFIIGAVISLLLLICGRKGRKDTIPFAPFINISFFISSLWGESIIFIYLKSII
ncbi:prepilin peptidase [Lutispora thermophila]|uniref:Prepilin leader peptidase/N-methyltransferase n=1 Tax=Lutispora thermophila DSM 19022 TaxID=1122184 RepID=A0A1M6F3J6_9FIRM|nr:A24 family peptidase [Lutispora thermophila]SHI92278.1 type 4 prepilin peptidase 1 Aspartic peptidase. MEROPS family A24A [Lutispora thermophila DSM 19022]